MILVPFNTGYHLAHHVDSGIPFRNLPRLQRALAEDGYLDGVPRHRSYRAFWRTCVRTPAESYATTRLRPGHEAPDQRRRRDYADVMPEAFFSSVSDPIPYEGPDSDNPLAFRWYDRDRVVRGRTMEEQLRFAVCYWHSFNWPGNDVFGLGTFDRPWLDPGADPMAAAHRQDGRRLRVLREARRAVLLLPRS